MWVYPKNPVGFFGYVPGCLNPVNRVTTCLENLEMSGNLKNVREKILSWKRKVSQNCSYINMHSFYANTLKNNTIYLTLTLEVLATVYLNTSISFGTVHSCNCELDSLIIYIKTSITGMLWVPLNMGMSAAHCQGISVSGEWSPCIKSFIIIFVPV